jgi:two-component system response regulator AtoC
MRAAMADASSLETVRLAPAPTPLDRPPLVLVLLDDAGARPVRLTVEGSLVIGRGEDADIAIDDVSISRRHAILHVGRTIQVEDLGSANGTVLRGERLAPNVRAEVQPGDVFEIGKTACVLRGPVTGNRPRRIWTHGYFEARLEDEVARAERRRASFAVLRFFAGETARTELENELCAALRPGDVAASYGSGEYEVLLLDLTPDELTEAAGSLAGRLARIAPKLRSGLAIYPRDGRSPEEILAHACAAVRPHKGGVAVAGIVVEDAAMRELYRLVERVARGSINVMLVGETGVGKEIVADRVHKESPRRDQPLLKLNCAALSETLLESELFGHEKGAFTGATAMKPGLLESADGGTVFLDEIGEMPVVLQAKLLRVLEDRQVRRVGALTGRTIDVRFLSATNRDPEAEVAAGRLRADLYFRLNGITLAIPPLRERTGEIDALAHSFAAASSRGLGLPTTPGFSDAARELLRHYRWPGNIRELRNVVERAVLLCGGDSIMPSHLPVEKMGTVVPVVRSGGSDRERLVEALARCHGNQTQAARLLGVSRRTLITWMESHKLPRPRKT